MSYVVYEHKSPEGKVYIGITSNINSRWANGFGYRDNAPFFEDIQKFGWNNFKHIIHHDNLSKEEAESIEATLIRLAKSANPEYGYNKNHSTTWFKNHSEENIVQARRNNPRSRAIQKLDNDNNVIQSFDSISEACRAINGYSTSLVACLNGRMKTYKGFGWRYTPAVD